MKTYRFSDEVIVVARTAEEARRKWLRLMRREAERLGLSIPKHAPRIIDEQRDAQLVRAWLAPETGRRQ